MRNPPSKRRQQSAETLLNKIFEDVIDQCFRYDREKIFHFPVKKKDAPNYANIIKRPIDLQ